MMGAEPFSDETRARSVEIEHLILLVHGIRTRMEWRDNVANVLLKDRDGQVLGSVEVVPLGYNYLDALRFWFPIGTRRGPVEEIRSRIIKARDLYPRARISVVAHSFGTYAVAKILRTTPISLHHLILCGCILPDKAQLWTSIRPYVRGMVRNDCCRRDIWPILAEATTFGYGASGTFGVGMPDVQDCFRILDGHDPHSGYLRPEFVSTYWWPLLHEDALVRPPVGPDAERTPWWRSVLKFVRYVVFALLTVLIVLLLLAALPVVPPHYEPMLRLLDARPGYQRVAVDAKTPPFSKDEGVKLVPSSHPGEFRYILAIDGKGKASLYPDDYMEKPAINWGWKIDEPPSQTILLLVFDHRLSNNESDQLVARINALGAAPRLTSGTNIVWSLGNWEVDPGPNSRGPDDVEDPTWAANVVRILREVRGISFFGRTIPVKKTNQDR